MCSGICHCIQLPFWYNTCSGYVSFNKETLPITKLTDLDVCTALPDSAPLEFTVWWWQKDVGMVVSDFEFTIWRHSLPTIAAKCRLPMWWYVKPRLNCSQKILHKDQNVNCSPYLIRWTSKVWQHDFERLYHILIHWSFSSTSMDPNNKLKDQNPPWFVKLFERALHDKSMTVYESSQ
jgi:hypothetical protein